MSRGSPHRGPEAGAPVRRDRRRLRQSGNHVDDLVALVAMVAGKLNQVTRSTQHGALLGRSSNCHAPSATKLKQPLVAQNPQCSEHGIGVDMQDSSQVFRRWHALSGTRLPVGDCASDLGCHLVMERKVLVSVDLDFQHAAMNTSTMLTRVEGPEADAPTEVLLPEAREHQRRRYLRTGLVTLICAALIVVLIVAGVILFGGSFADGRTSGVNPAVSSTAVARGTVYFRPVLCFAPPYDSANLANSAAVPACNAASQLSSQNLNVQRDNAPLGYTSNNVPVDTALAGVSSSKPSNDTPTSTVLLPGLSGKGQPSNAERFLLGPAEMSSRAVASAVAEQNKTGQWVVSYTTTSAGSVVWDKAAHQNFHQLIGIELNGVVYSAPIIEPSQSSFSSFEGRGEIGGSLTRSDAFRLAAALEDHR